MLWAMKKMLKENGTMKWFRNLTLRSLGLGKYVYLLDVRISFNV
jgi:hypothetical protein